MRKLSVIGYLLLACVTTAPSCAPAQEEGLASLAGKPGDIPMYINGGTVAPSGVTIDDIGGGGKVDADSGTSWYQMLYYPEIYNGYAENLGVWGALNVNGRPYDMTFNLSQLANGTYVTSPNSASGWDGTGWQTIKTNLFVYAHPTTDNPAERFDLTYSLPLNYYNRATLIFDGFASAGLTNSSQTNLHGIFQDWSPARRVFTVNTSTPSFTGFGGWKTPDKTNLNFNAFNFRDITNKLYPSLVTQISDSQALINTNGFTVIFKVSGTYGTGWFLTFTDASQTVFKMGIGGYYLSADPRPYVRIGGSQVVVGDGWPNWSGSGAGNLYGLVAFRFRPNAGGTTSVDCFRLLPNEPNGSYNWGINSTAVISAPIPSDIGAVIIGANGLNVSGSNITIDKASAVNVGVVVILNYPAPPEDVLEINGSLSKKSIWNNY